MERRAVTLDDTIARILRELFGVGDGSLSEQTTPGEIPGWDSLANVNVMFALERELGVRLDDADFAPVRDIGELKARLRRHGAT
jgi:acyl carrier protein